MMVPSSFDLIIHGTGNSAINIIYKKYILFKAYLKYKYDVDSPWHWLHLELHRWCGHSTAMLILSNPDAIFYVTLYLLALIYSDSLAINILNFFLS